jgi:acetylornithine deacetylase/succinyl-diaminopimelate desuccinylase-like protein
MATSGVDKAVLGWLNSNKQALTDDLAALVAVESVSPGGAHEQDIHKCAALVAEQMRKAGLENVELLRSGDSAPFVYGDFLHAPGKPTVFLYAHYDVQPVTDPDKWKTEPFTLTPKAGRLYGRGSADDKGAITAQLAAISAYLRSNTPQPVNVKMVVEGEEEVGSENLLPFFKKYKKKLLSDVIVVCDTENYEIGTPAITYSLRGVVNMVVEVEAARDSKHSGTVGGLMPDPVLALNVILSRLYWKDGRIPVPGLYDRVRKLTSAEKRSFQELSQDEAHYREEFDLLPGIGLAGEKGVSPLEQTWRRPSVTVIAQVASSIEKASNQVRPNAKAIVSTRLVPDQDPQETYEQFKGVLTKDPPWGLKVTVKPSGSAGKWWMTEPTGPAFTAATEALQAGFKKTAVGLGSGGAIPFVGPLATLFGEAPALLLGIEDSKSNAHAANESLHEGDWRKLMTSLAYLFQNIGNLTPKTVK